MSEPKIISPLLDGFTLGTPISEHHGVVCYPAIKENTNKKYIVKMITVPASQAQFDALLLAGAYKDPGDAMEYFRETAEDLLKEAELLKKLSKLEGFLPYDGCQMEPITRRRLGYEVYLVGSYKRSLEKYIRKNAFTHLGAVNLGLDLCSALSVCRQSGYLYVDLKPSNIYVSEKKEFRIGDLGFLDLNALRYASLPERYFSPYTPPELLDPMTPMNLTVDTYAVGMILYQLYNDGQLPFSGTAPLETLPSPCHADYEMAEIIMKAIHPEPDQRWSDPKDLGKAIASYMQRNSVNDIPITPFIPLDVKEEDIVVISDSEASGKEADSSAEEEITSMEPEQLSEEEPAEPCESAAQEEPLPMPSSDNPEQALPSEEDADEKAVIEAPEEPEPLQESPDSPETPQQAEPPSDTLEQEEDASLTEISEEVAKIISKAEDIIAHEIPEELTFPKEEELPDPFAFAKDESEDTDEGFPVEPLMEDTEETDPPKKKKKTKHFEDSTRKKKVRKFFSRVFLLLLAGGLCSGGFWYYQNVYLQNIDSISISGSQTEITILVDTAVEESMLSVHCTDENGKRRTSSVEGGKATFTGLQPSTQYTIELDMDGFHKLSGHTAEVFTTDATTQILAFHAIAGSDDGSVLLNFTVDGEEPNFWNIHYVADGEEEKVETVTSHSATINGLTVGKIYTFTLYGDQNFDLGGKKTIQYLASKLILAEELTVTSSGGGDLTVHWKTPGDVVVENWNVRCFDGYGFEEQATVTENQVLFTGLDPSTSYAVEVTASGMTQPSRISISADPIHITDFQADESAKTKMKVTWDHNGTAPEGGWLLSYTVDGSGSQVIECEKASAEISPLIPGANYQFVLQAADSRTVCNNTLLHRTNEATDFSEHNVVLENLSFDLLKTPEDPEWHYETIREESFTTTFAAEDSASMVLRTSSPVYLPGNKTTAMFLFRDTYGNVLPELMTEETFTWKNIWMTGDSKTGEMNVPKLPSVPGKYVMELYFNGGFVTQFEITIEE